MRVNDDQQGGYQFSTDAAAGLISRERDEERNWGSCRRWCHSFQKKTPEAIAQSLSHWGRWEFRVALAACSLVYFTSEGWSWVILLWCNLIMNERLPVINNVVLLYDLSLDFSPFFMLYHYFGGPLGDWAPTFVDIEVRQLLHRLRYEDFYHQLSDSALIELHRGRYRFLCQYGRVSAPAFTRVSPKKYDFYAFQCTSCSRNSLNKHKHGLVCHYQVILMHGKVMVISGTPSLLKSP